MAPSVLPQFVDPRAPQSVSVVNMPAPAAATRKYVSAVAESGGVLTVVRRSYSVTVTNTSGADAFLQLFGSATLPADGAIPAVSIPVAAGQVQFYDIPSGIPWAVGLAFCLSSTLATKTISGAGIFMVVYSE